MVVSAAWAAEHLQGGGGSRGALDLTRLYATNGVDAAPPPLPRFAATTPLPELLAAVGALSVFCLYYSSHTRSDQSRVRLTASARAGLSSSTGTVCW